MYVYIYFYTYPYHIYVTSRDMTPFYAMNFFLTGQGDTSDNESAGSAESQTQAKRLMISFGSLRWGGQGCGFFWLNMLFDGSNKLVKLQLLIVIVWLSLRNTLPPINMVP